MTNANMIQQLTQARNDAGFTQSRTLTLTQAGEFVLANLTNSQEIKTPLTRS